MRAVEVKEAQDNGKQLIFELWANDIDFKGFDARLAYDSSNYVPSNLITNVETDDENEYFAFESEFEGKLDLITIPYSAGNITGIRMIISFAPPVEDSENIKNMTLISSGKSVLLGKMSFKMKTDTLDISNFRLIEDSTTSPTTGIKINVNIQDSYEEQSTFIFTNKTASSDALLNNMILSSGTRNAEEPIKSTYKEYELIPIFDKQNKEYTLDNFIFGDCNKLALGTAKLVVENTEKCYNPLLIYGKNGVGKTHFMHAIGNKMLEKNPEANILYVTTEKFIDQFIDAIKNDELNLFRDTYRNADVLLIDDIQFISGKERIQSEFLSTFMALKEIGKQIIISSNKPPKDIDILDDRLKSRLESGIFVELLMPDYDTKAEIMKKYAEEIKCDLDSKTMSSILKYDNLNIQKIEGILNQLKLVGGAETTDELEKIIDFYKK